LEIKYLDKAMITLEVAKKQGILAKFSKPDPDFVISSKSDLEAENNIMEMLKIKDLLNNNLSISNYSDDLKNLTLTYLVLQPEHNGVKWKERKYYKKKEQKYFIDISFPEYDRFCKSDKRDALKIMAEQTIRGTKKYLSKEKNFDYTAFYKDLTNILRKKNIINEIKEYKDSTTSNLLSNITI